MKPVEALQLNIFSDRPKAVLLLWIICDIFVTTTLLHNLIKDKLDLIERTFNREGSPYLACNDRNAFFTSENLKSLLGTWCIN